MKSELFTDEEINTILAKPAEGVEDTIVAPPLQEKSKDENRESDEKTDPTPGP